MRADDSRRQSSLMLTSGEGTLRKHPSSTENGLAGAHTCSRAYLELSSCDAGLLPVVQCCDVLEAEPLRHLGSARRRHKGQRSGQPLQRGHVRMVWQALQQDHNPG
jgi:hypothetical protein